MFIADSDTWIFPTIELPPCDIHVDSQTTKDILKVAPKNSVVHLASGYFNLTKSYVDAILSSKAEFTLLMAHPTVSLIRKYIMLVSFSFEWKDD